MDTAAAPTPFDAFDKYGVGIWRGIEEEEYHASRAVSRSDLWTIYTKTPAHYRFAEPVEKPAFDFGAAVHTGILQPHLFDKKVMKGPKDRRGNLWKDMAAEATNQGKKILPAPEFEAVQLIIDTVAAHPLLNSLVTSQNALVEHTVFWREETGDGDFIPCRARPDLVRPDLGLIVDVKTTTSASVNDFAKSIATYGYHLQEYWYVRGWSMAGGLPLKGMVFVAIEKEAPFALQVFELDPSSVADAGAVCQKALGIYNLCEAEGRWPGYPDEVQQISLPRWGYRETVV